MTAPGPLLQMLAGLRRASGLSQHDVAASMGTQQSAVSDLENGRVDSRLSTLVRYAEAIGVELEVTIRASAPIAALLPIAVPEPSEEP